MSSDFLWHLPTHGDSRGLVGGALHANVVNPSFRKPKLECLVQVAKAKLEEAVRVGEQLLPLVRTQAQPKLQAAS